MRVKYSQSTRHMPRKSVCARERERDEENSLLFFLLLLLVAVCLTLRISVHVLFLNIWCWQFSLVRIRLPRQVLPFSLSFSSVFLFSSLVTPTSILSLAFFLSLSLSCNNLYHNQNVERRARTKKEKKNKSNFTTLHPLISFPSF